VSPLTHLEYPENDPGANTSLSPLGDTSTATIAPEVNLNSNEVFQNLIESVEARNRVRLNVSKRYCRLDRNNLEVVSDNEVKVDLPNVNSFMNIANSHPVDTPGDRTQRGFNDMPSLATGANVALTAENPTPPEQGSSGNGVWQAMWNLYPPPVHPLWRLCP